jgi:hypothetical protein
MLFFGHIDENNIAGTSTNIDRLASMLDGDWSDEDKGRGWWQ